MASRVVAVAALLLFAGLAQASIDLRVSPALLGHGQRVRLSVIDGNPKTNYDGFFDYNENFQQKWTNMSLHSTLVPVPYGTTQTFNIAGETVQIQIPNPTEGIEGIMFGDPCVYHTDFEFPCMDQVDYRLPALVNAISAGQRPGKINGIDFWSILGDNFYDRTGHLSSKFMSDVTLQSKTVPLYTVIGNHDYWIMGQPLLRTPWDQYGKGFMQYYGQDTYSGLSDPVNFLNFSAAATLHDDFPQASNFFQYSTLGNVGFIGYSGAYTWEESSQMFADACQALGATSIQWLFVLGHWNAPGDGCPDGMDVPSIVAKLATVPGCDQFASRTRGFFGHQHCNKVVQQDSLYMIGGTGFLAECQQAGFVYLATTNNVFTLVLFDFGSDATFNPLITCLNSNPISACTHLGTTWVSATVDLTASETGQGGVSPNATKTSISHSTSTSASAGSKSASAASKSASSTGHTAV